MPDFELENTYNGAVFGLDEVGRGPLAGPVVAACVHFPKSTYTLPFVLELRDSKKLSELKLQELYDGITTHCAWAVAEIAPDEIDHINILQASLKAMEMAFLKLLSSRLSEANGGIFSNQPDRRSLDYARDDMNGVFALVDGNKLPNLPCPSECVVKGDNKSNSIAAASIVAKITRDHIMRDLHGEYPHYGWDRNVGYPTQEHRDAIDQCGITPHHRKSFAPVKNFLATGSTRKPQDSAA